MKRQELLDLTAQDTLDVRVWVELTDGTKLKNVTYSPASGYWVGFKVGTKFEYFETCDVAKAGLYNR